MGLFGKLFDKKICDICGGEIGLLGNRKLEDGNCCKECAALLSPFLTDRRRTTVDEIRAHIAYREENRQQLGYFNVSRVYGSSTKIYFDDNAGRFFVTPYANWIQFNPDIIDIAQIADCTININESRHEEYARSPEGERVRFDPPRYSYTYDFYINILVRSPWFDHISFKLSDESATAPFDPLYHEYERQADEIRMTLLPGAEPLARYAEPPRPAPGVLAGMAAGVILGQQGIPAAQGRPIPRPTGIPVEPRPVGVEPRPAARPAGAEPRPMTRPTGVEPRPAARPEAVEPRPMTHPAGVEPRPATRPTGVEPRLAARPAEQRSAGVEPRPATRPTGVEPRPAAHPAEQRTPGVEPRPAVRPAQARPAGAEPRPAVNSGNVGAARTLPRTPSGEAARPARPSVGQAAPSGRSGEARPARQERDEAERDNRPMPRPNRPAGEDRGGRRI